MMSKTEVKKKRTIDIVKKLNISFITLRFFSSDTEAAYRKFHFDNSLGYFRISFIVLTIMYSFFGYIDYIGTQANISTFYVIRYLIVLPLFISTLLLSCTKIFEKVWQIALLINYIIAGLGISIMIVIEPSNMFYYAGLFLIFQAGFFFIRLRFWEATLSGFFTLLLYNITIIVMGTEGFQPGYLVISNAFYGSSLIIGVVGLFYQELHHREGFVDKQEVVNANLHIENINNNLEKTINERTRIVLKRNRELKQEISHRKQIEEQLLDAKEKAEESNQLKNKFIRSISHEVRTPMNAILGFLNIIYSRLEVENPELEDYKRLVNRNSNLLLQIIDNTLDISKIHSKSMFFSKKYVDLKEVCKTKYQELHEEIQPSYDFNLILPKEPINQIYTDYERVEQLIGILLNNAFKFTNEGSVTLKLFEDRHLKEYVIEVIDTGIGIDEHLQDEIFKPFDKYDDFQQGIGLGLFIARSIAENLNIKIELESKKGAGSTFRLRFMMYNEVEFNFPKIKLSNKQRGKILVSEDNADNFLLIKELLSEKYDLEWKRSGFDTLEYFRKHPVDMVILDILMPGIDGIEVCERIRKMNPTIPIVMLSAMVQPETQEKAKNAGANLFLFKPIDMELETQIDKFFIED